MNEEERFMTIEKTHGPGTLTLKLEGRLDTVTAPELEVDWAISLTASGN